MGYYWTARYSDGTLRESAVYADKETCHKSMMDAAVKLLSAKTEFRLASSGEVTDASFADETALIRTQSGSYSFEMVEDSGIMDTLNSHDPGLVSLINRAWADPGNRRRFKIILLALLTRDKKEFDDMFLCDVELSEDSAWENAHSILEYICDDDDLRTVLGFLR